MKIISIKKGFTTNSSGSYEWFLPTGKYYNRQQQLKNPRKIIKKATDKNQIKTKETDVRPVKFIKKNNDNNLISNILFFVSILTGIVAILLSFKSFLPLFSKFKNNKKSDKSK